MDKSKVLSLVLHCCDVSHPSKPWSLHRHWTDLLLEEFFRQGDNEKELGLPYSPLCDRNTTLVAESQIGESIHYRGNFYRIYPDISSFYKKDSLSLLWSRASPLWATCWSGFCCLAPEHRRQHQAVDPTVTPFQKRKRPITVY